MRPYHQKLPQEPMRILVRHAEAVARQRWRGPDELRGLTPIGHAQAEALAGRFSGLPVLRVLSSPSLRCRQTVAPLACEAGLAVESCRLLSPSADPVRLARFVLAGETENAVICTHRETLLGVFAWLAVSGSRFIDGVAPMDMAAAWLLCGGGDLPIRLRHLRHPGRPDRRISPVGRPELSDQR